MARWLYFLLPPGEALHHHRERGFLWGYGHFFAFASLATLGSGLSVAADIFKPETKATAVNAICLIGLAQAVFIVSVCGLYSYVTHTGRRNLPLVIISALTILIVVAATHNGLSISWSILLLNLPTIGVIFGFERCAKSFK